MSVASRLGPAIPRRPATDWFIGLRGLRYHLLRWGDPSLATFERPPLVLLHGWMDVAASFQFVVDAMADERFIVAPDWRGFGLTEGPAVDSYNFSDYLGDLDALLDALSAEAVDAKAAPQAVDLLGHSLGGNVAMVYAGVRPQRIRRLVNLEGFGMPESHPSQAPGRYAKWLDELKRPAQLRQYDSVDAVAGRLRKTNPLLPAERADWLAAQWSRPRVDPDGVTRWHILADAAHMRIHPHLYQKAEVLACWERISAPLLWVEGDLTDTSRWWGNRYLRSDFDARLAVVRNVTKQLLSPAGHMLHHDQPEALAERLQAFLDD